MACDILRRHALIYVPGTVTEQRGAFDERNVYYLRKSNDGKGHDPACAEGGCSRAGQREEPRVTVTLNGYTFRSTIQVYGGQSGLPFHAEDREAAGVEAGDEVEVTMALDLEPRTVEVPDDLAAALAETQDLRERFDALAYSKRKEFVRQVTSAKTQETRERRISKVVEQLKGS